MSKVIRTRNGQCQLPSKTLHIGIKASRIGGRNVWNHTKGKLEKLSEATAQNNPENQAIDRVQKRIMRHAPKTVVYTGKAVRSGVRVSKDLIQHKYAQKKEKQKSNDASFKQDREYSKQNQRFNQKTTRLRTKSSLKNQGKKLALHGKKALFQQAKQGIRTKQDQFEKVSAENSASSHVEKTALKVSPTLAKKGAKVAVLPIRLGKRAIWTIDRKSKQNKTLDRKDELRQHARASSIRNQKQLQVKHAKLRTKANMKLRNKESILAQESMDRSKTADLLPNEKQSPRDRNPESKWQQKTNHDDRKYTSQKHQYETNYENKATTSATVDAQHKSKIRTQSKQNVRSRNAKGELHTRSIETSSKQIRFKQQAVPTVQSQNKMIHTRKKWFTIRKTKGRKDQANKTNVLQQAKTIALRAMKRSAKMVEKTIKAVATAIKALIASVGGGALLIALIILIAGAGLIFASPFGIFFGAEKPETHHIPAVVAEINAEFMQQVRANASDEIDIEGDSPVYNWIDVLAVFAVKTSTDMSNPLDVGTMDETKKAILKQIFYDMNEISTVTETVTETDAQGNQTTKTVTKTVVVGKTWEEMIPIYNFNEEQEKLLREIMQGEYYEMFIELIGLPPAQASPLTPDEWEKLNQELPAGANTSEIVKKAFERLGDPYSQAKRGQGRYVDCSYFVKWVYGHFNVSLPSTAAEQAHWCVESNLTVSYNNLQAGDLVFFASGTNGRYMNVDHVGLVRPARTK